MLAILSITWTMVSVVSVWCVHELCGFRRLLYYQCCERLTYKLKISWSLEYYQEFLVTPTCLDSTALRLPKLVAFVHDLYDPREAQSKYHKRHFARPH